MAAPVEVVRLNQAIQAFKERAPRDLPKGVMEGLESVEKELGAYAPLGEQSPGKREALKGQAPGTDGTGEHFSKAARGVDGPSPGQQEAKRLSTEMMEAAAELKDRL